MRDLLLYDPSQQGLPLGRDFITYLFIKFAERSLKTKRSISFVVISYLRDHLQLSSSMQSPFMEYCIQFIATSGCRFEEAALGAPGTFLEPNSRDESTR